LLRLQQYDGSWKDAFWTGTGFPKVFYLRYHLYATYFPLWALSLLERQLSAERADARTAQRAPAPAPATARVAVHRTRE